MQLAVAQYQDATNVLGHTVAGSSIQRIEPVLNHDCFHTPITLQNKLEREHEDDAVK